MLRVHPTTRQLRPCPNYWLVVIYNVTVNYGWIVEIKTTTHDNLNVDHGLSSSYCVGANGSPENPTPSVHTFSINQGGIFKIFKINISSASYCQTVNCQPSFSGRITITRLSRSTPPLTKSS